MNVKSPQYPRQAPPDTDAPGDMLKQDSGTVFGRLRQAIARLESAGEALETVNNRINPRPSQGASGPQGPGPEPSLDTLLERCLVLSSFVAEEANLLANAIGG